MAYVGQSVIGKTNRILAAGKGTYVADISLPGTAHMAIVRSPHAHAWIRTIDVSQAQAIAGVLTTITGEEIRKATNPIPTHSPALGEKGFKLYALPTDKVRYVGEPVVAVVAEDPYTARQAADRIEVTYEELPPVIDVAKARRPGAPLVVKEWGDNVLTASLQRHGDPDRRLQEAAGVVRGVVRTQRYTGAALEPRGYLASYER